MITQNYIEIHLSDWNKLCCNSLSNIHSYFHRSRLKHIVLNLRKKSKTLSKIYLLVCNRKTKSIFQNLCWLLKYSPVKGNATHSRDSFMQQTECVNLFILTETENKRSKTMDAFVEMFQSLQRLLAPHCHQWATPAIRGW